LDKKGFYDDGKKKKEKRTIGDARTCKSMLNVLKRKKKKNWK
jgi:hypothetical protein